RVERHVGAAPGAVDREEAHARARNGEKPRVNLGHQFVRSLGGAVERDRGQDGIALVKWYLAVSSVDGARGGVDEVANSVRTAGLEHAEEPIQVGAHIIARRLEGAAYTRLRGQMHHIVRSAIGKQRFEPVVVGDVAGRKTNPLVGGEPGKAGALEAPVVLAVEFVEAVQGAARGEQALSEMKADETRRARHQDRV